MSRIDFIKLYPVKWIPTGITEGDVSVLRGVDSSMSDKPYLVYFYVDVPSAEYIDPNSRPGKPIKKKRKYTFAQEVCKYLGEKIFTGENLQLMAISREYDMFERKCTVQEDAPRIYLCFPDGRVYKKYVDKVSDATLCRDMRNLLKVIDGELARRSLAREVAAKDWQFARVNKYELSEQLKQEEAKFNSSVNKKKTMPQRILLLRKQISDLDNKMQKLMDICLK